MSNYHMNWPLAKDGFMRYFLKSGSAIRGTFHIPINYFIIAHPLIQSTKKRLSFTHAALMNIDKQNRD